jgi:hypothetical protein
MLAMTVVSNEARNWNEMLHREIEIMQITKYTTDSIDREIIGKLKDKLYIRETGLVVYLNRTTQIKDMKALSVELRKNNVSVSDVWVIACTSEDSLEYTLFSLFPTVQVTVYNLIDEMNKLEAGDSIDMIFSKGIKMELERGVQVTKFIP